ncbi:MAG: DUF5668 domain-containing protein [Actinomycetota bacterium]|nr:MAG: hypothetical protein FD171_1327 [Actinomycetota bacterium]MDO8949377.1 DUF5668 domain-containing protein [Actinomycetota bacterium]MDP3630501.1 DUF5668 domain-containing protein [Actinomycetota bacterium]
MELKRAAEGLTLVAVGLILLGNTLGMIPWGVWWNILSLWPILLVAAGVDIIGRGTDNSWLRVLSSLVVIAGLVYGALVMPASTERSIEWPFVMTLPSSATTPTKSFDFSEPHTSAVTKGRAQVKGGVGQLNINGGTALATSSGRSPFTPVFEVGVSGNEANVDLSMGDGSWVSPRDVGRLDVTLDRDVVWDVEIDAGVSTIDADLSKLSLSKLVVKSGVSKGTIALGEVDSIATDGGVPVMLDTGVSSITVRIKRGESVRLHVDTGLSSVNKASEFVEVQGTSDKKVYETEGFSDAAFWDITLDAGISSVRIEFY